MTAPTVNAYYNPAGNEIVFPAGIMQFPVFGSELPNYINYGAFGAVAGHELSHAFDNNGRHYDVHGNLTDWWTEHTVEGFETRAECFVDEYSNFTVAGPNGTTLHVKGRQTLGENIADAGGLSAAFNVWKKRQQGSPNLDLPGLDFFSQEVRTFQFRAHSHFPESCGSPKVPLFRGIFPNRGFLESIYFDSRVVPPPVERTFINLLNFIATILHFLWELLVLQVQRASTYQDHLHRRALAEFCKNPGSCHA